MSLATRLEFDETRILGWALIGANYSAIGDAFAHPIVSLYVQNLTDALLTFTFNTNYVDGQFVLPANGYFLYDATANKGLSQSLYFEKNKTLFVKQYAIPTTGNVFVSTVYGVER